MALQLYAAKLCTVEIACPELYSAFGGETYADRNIILRFRKAHGGSDDRGQEAGPALHACTAGEPVPAFACVMRRGNCTGQPFPGRAEQAPVERQVHLSRPDVAACRCGWRNARSIFRTLRGNSPAADRAPSAGRLPFASFRIRASSPVTGTNGPSSPSATRCQLASSGWPARSDPRGADEHAAPVFAGGEGLACPMHQRGKWQQRGKKLEPQQLRRCSQQPLQALRLCCRTGEY